MCSNLLRPSGVRLVHGTLTIRIYRAEDMPQMDPLLFDSVKKYFVDLVEKDMVDPYCIVSFAGHKGKTHYIEHEENPEWNKEIHLGVRVRAGER